MRRMSEVFRGPLHTTAWDPDANREPTDSVLMFLLEGDLWGGGRGEYKN